jgi:hypothetical protein
MRNPHVPQRHLPARVAQICRFTSQPYLSDKRHCCVLFVLRPPGRSRKALPSRELAAGAVAGPAPPCPRLPPLVRLEPKERSNRGRCTECDTGTGATVVQLPKLRRNGGPGYPSQSETDLPNFYRFEHQPLVEVKGLEPSTYGLQSRRSSS